MSGTLTFHKVDEVTLGSESAIRLHEQNARHAYGMAWKTGDEKMYEYGWQQLEKLRNLERQLKEKKNER